MSEGRTHWSEFGNPNGSPVVFAHGLGLASSVWQSAMNAMESRHNCRFITYDLPGHGASQNTQGRGSMGALVRNLEALCDDLNIRDSVIVGHGLGGMCAQGLAVKRLDLVRGLVLVNTSAKLGTKDHWAAQIELIKSGDPLKVTTPLWEKWFSRSARASPLFAPWKATLENTDPRTLVSSIEALSGTDFYTPISGLGLPTLGLSAYNDQMFPPDLMRETLDVIKGSEFKIIPRVGHLSMLEAPEDFAAHVDTFLHQIGHHKSPDI